MRKSIILAGLLALLPSFSHAKTLEDLLVEKGIVTKGEVQATQSGVSKVYWNKGTRLEFPDNGFSAQINTMIQSRYTFSDNDEKAGAHNTSSFDIRRARIILSGNALHEEFSYYLNTDFVSSTNNGTKSPSLLDAYLTWHACDWADVRFGQFKTPVSRQFNSSDYKTQFAEASVASNFFNQGRQAGLAGNVKLLDGALWVGASIFNGSSDGEGLNRSGVDTKHLGAVNVRWDALGKMDITEEGDQGWTEDPALNVGAVYAHSQDNNDIGAGRENVDTDIINGDLNFKYAGWSFHGEYFYANSDPDIGDTVHPQGFYGQVGWFFDPKTTEIAARYSLLDCDNGKVGGECSGNDKINQVDVALNYYFWSHYLEATLQYRHDNQRVLGNGDDINDNKYLFQLSGYF